MRRTHTIPNLTREMAELQVARSVLLPIDYPFLSHNAEAWLEAAATRDELVCLGSVHSHARRIGERLEKQKAMGGPRGQGASSGADGPSGPPPLHGPLPGGRRPGAADHVALRTGGHRAQGGPTSDSQLKHYWPAIRENPDTTFILGHSGALQPEMGVELANLYSNAHLDLSCQSLPATRMILRDGPIDRIMFGSDWPFYHQGFALAKVFPRNRGTTGRATDGALGECRPVLRARGAKRIDGCHTQD